MSAKWSYSSMSLFQQCPRKYYELRVAKSIKEATSEQMRYGLLAHKAAEDFIGEAIPLPPQFDFMQEPLEKLRDMAGDSLCEYKMGLTYDLEPCDFDSPDVWWRGIADLLKINKTKARLVDYKTGKSGYPDLKQLELLSLATFKHFPEVDFVQAGLLFLVHPRFVTVEVRRNEEDVRWEKWFAQSGELDAAFHNDVWNPKQNFTCRGWCPVEDCHHWSPKPRR